MKFQGKLLVIGCGSVSQCALPLILKLIDMPGKNITIMDFVDNRSRVRDVLDQGVNYVMDRITRENYSQLLAKYVGAGDMIIDLAWNIDCCAMLQWCHHQIVGHDAQAAVKALQPACRPWLHDIQYPEADKGGGQPEHTRQRGDVAGRTCPGHIKPHISHDRFEVVDLIAES